MRNHHGANWQEATLWWNSLGQLDASVGNRSLAFPRLWSSLLMDTQMWQELTFIRIGSCYINHCWCVNCPLWLFLCKLQFTIHLPWYMFPFVIVWCLPNLTWLWLSVKHTLQFIITGSKRDEELIRAHYAYILIPLISKPTNVLLLFLSFCCVFVKNMLLKMHSAYMKYYFYTFCGSYMFSSFLVFLL